MDRGQSYLCESYRVGVAEDSYIHQNIWQIEDVEKSEESQTDPSSFVEYRHEERWESDEIDEAVQAEYDLEQGVLRHDPDDEVEEEHKTQCEVDLWDP